MTVVINFLLTSHDVELLAKLLLNIALNNRYVDKNFISFYKLNRLIKLYTA